jgi:hypothetical protein
MMKVYEAWSEGEKPGGSIALVPAFGRPGHDAVGNKPVDAPC